MTRPAVLDHVASLVPATASRIAIDGVDGAGKTVFADELAVALGARGRVVRRASVDGFHAPRAVRHARGRHSPEGFYRDSYDYELMERVLLAPWGPGGSRRYRAAAFDHVTDTAVDAEEEHAPDGAVLVVDGVFTHRPELLSHWDFTVFLRVPFAVSAARLRTRDGASTPTDRYVEGQRLYLAECDPERRATVVVDNTDLANPVVARATMTP